MLKEKNNRQNHGCRKHQKLILRSIENENNHPDDPFLHSDHNETIDHDWNLKKERKESEDVGQKNDDGMVQGKKDNNHNGKIEIVG